MEGEPLDREGSDCYVMLEAARNRGRLFRP